MSKFLLGITPAEREENARILDNRKRMAESIASELRYVVNLGAFGLACYLIRDKSERFLTADKKRSETCLVRLC
jgi:hypothetical protein